MAMETGAICTSCNLGPSVYLDSCFGNSSVLSGVLFGLFFRVFKKKLIFFENSIKTFDEKQKRI